MRMRSLVGTILVGSFALLTWPHATALAQAPGPSTAPGVPILMTRRFSPDGKVPTGTIWRAFQTWQTDVARTAKGDLAPVDPLTPRMLTWTPRITPIRTR